MFKSLSTKVSDDVKVTVDGIEVTAFAEESVASVLLRTTPHYARLSALSGKPHGPYCMMGVCFECLAVVDGMHGVQTCQTRVQEGMVIQRQDDRGKGQNYE